MSLPQNIKQVHFIGIGGYGMSALALILLKKGYQVSGSDLKESALTVALAAQGALITIGHRPENISTAQLVIYSTAVPDANPEIAETTRRGLTLWHRSELLAALMNSAYGIAIAGAHGKTTTTAMVALLLEAGGLDPTAIIGGVLPAYNSNARLGASRYLVAEADESDSSFTRYHPQLALVTGIEPDHLEHYENDYARLQQAYAAFLSNLPADGAAVLCFDDPALREFASQLDCTVISYALADHKANKPDYYAANLVLGDANSTFNLYCRDKLYADAVILGVPGSHNVSNAVGALALVNRLGLDLASCAKVLADFHGVARRFELIGTAGDIIVIDDYAHHPTEIKATIATARLSGRRIICMFQPHRYSRTATFFDQFALAFTGADLLFLHSVYAAGEAPLPEATSEALAEQIRKQSNVPVVYSDDMGSLEVEAAEAARPGDMIITMGAGDITTAASRVLTRLQEKNNRR